ncbi:MAG: hypothetical protein E3K40_03340 [Candidatus Brocadia sp.]|nr:PilZ domain-containing protein [Candidatus Brocadia sp.]MDG6025744.1 hypothetical protein [Candidatus Brocadia sp.]
MMNTNHILPADKLKIEVMEVIGGLIGNGALEIQTHLYKCLDEGRRYHLLDFEQVHKIDGLGITILKNLLSRGLQIRLINVKPEVQGIISMAKSESFFKIMHNEKDRTMAVSLFEKDILEKKVIAEDGDLKKRCHIRINTSFPLEFKFHRNHRTTSVRANILNLSEGGILAGHIVTVKENTEEDVHYLGMAEQDIYDMKFKLNGNSTSLTMQGRCVWEFMIGESLYAGIRFHEISHRQKEMIRSFVDTHK